RDTFGVAASTTGCCAWSERARETRAELGFARLVDGPAAPGIDGAGAGATSQSMTKVAGLADPRQCPPMADLSMPAATQLSRRTYCGQAAPAGILGSFERRVALSEAPAPSFNWRWGVRRGHDPRRPSTRRSSHPHSCQKQVPRVTLGKSEARRPLTPKRWE